MSDTDPLPTGFRYFGTLLRQDLKSPHYSKRSNKFNGKSVVATWLLRQRQYTHGGNHRQELRTRVLINNTRTEFLIGLEFPFYI